MNFSAARASALLATFCMTGCVSPDTSMGVDFKRQTQFQSEWEMYLEFAPNKAMAITGDVEGRYVMGYSHLLPTEDMAIAEALEACELRRQDRKVDSPCSLYAIGDEPVGTSATLPLD